MANTLSLVTPNLSTTGQGASGPQTHGEFRLEPWRIVGDGAAVSTVLKPLWLRRIDYWMISGLITVTDAVVDNTVVPPTLTLTNSAMTLNKVAFIEIYGQWG